MAFAIAICASFWSQIVYSELGATTDSVRADQVRFKASRLETSGPGMITHEIKLQDGSGIKEYVNSSGVVFAVSWRTRLKPNLQTLLGAQYAMQIASTKSVLGVANSRAQQSVRLPNLVLHQAGRVNAFAGLAYVPALVPEGINAENLP